MSCPTLRAKLQPETVERKCHPAGSGLKVIYADAPDEARAVDLPVSYAARRERLLSLDVLRGFTAFWMMGGRELLLAAVVCFCPALFDAVETQVTHRIWAGYVAWDLVMPLFLFLVGTSLPFALNDRREQLGLWPTYRRIARRVVVLWILGMIAQGSLLKFDLHGLEWYSNALQAIAVGYLVASIALLHLPLAGQLILFAVLVLVYWVLLAFVPFAEHSAGTLEKAVNFARHIDELLLGSHRRDHSFTWVITSLGFAATVLLGVMGGHLLRSSLSTRQRLLWLVVIGFACLAGGWLWSFWLPLNRHLWTSSMILWAGGWSFLLLALFHAVVDVAGISFWTFPFVVIGSNALLAYVFDCVFGRTISDELLLNLAQQWQTPYDELVLSAGAVGLLWMILLHFYRNRIFLRA
jgi:predicted acyltransferase